MTEYYYRLDVGQLPDELYREPVPVKEWLQRTIACNKKEGFPKNSLNQLLPIPWDVEAERIVGISLYMVGNVLPFLLPLLCLLAFFFQSAKYVLLFVFLYTGTLFVVERFYFQPKFKKQGGIKPNDVRHNQYLFTERNITKYLSLKVVWPKSLQRPAMERTPVIYCMVPHGVAPFGITAYPIWSKLWNDQTCHWTCAPVLLKLPIISYFLKEVGYIPAKSKHILNTLTKKGDNVGLVLDGIAGMFHHGKDEVATLKARKGIVKIALRAGAPLIPVYGFGHTAMYTVVVDPFGILEWLSLTLQASLTPFFGRWGWFLGPPRRVPVTVCLGQPIKCPQIDEPTKEQVDEYHQQLLNSYQELFETHKHACGLGQKTL
eukprot:CAMPEP_0194221258 /NCGR_PEP_ID=MMETSP0156-20130528/30270_1 /TAXON_ID=33649 /ORGANISM="Thalassionema nitzschioides, Strain L26-B" /LENGTH=373 /DNA_ID=CAMNT_0038951611 /DNA_START=33 /DNA_END=1150 /DNA_ORIENTATION=-